MAGFAPELLAKLAAVGLYAPMGMGERFFVTGGASGSDTLNDGKSFQKPFKTIAHALDQCVDERGDYIFCFNVYQQDTFPIDVDVISVHIIGIAGPAGQWPLMVPTADTAIFNFPISQGENAEIAGFSLGAGDNHACIELQGENEMVHIHNCSFGHMWSAGGQDGIKYLNGAVNHGGVVEDCWFYGNALGGGKLTRCGILLDSGWLNHGTWRNNYFFKLPGKDIGEAGNVGGAICANGWLTHSAIIHNKINVGADAASGNGIYLCANCDACLVSQNEANDGLAASTKNPFVDVAGANDNAWASNQWAVTMAYPATSVA